MESNIFCHICDEELADTIENLPDKCPICDTRKYEIIQELQSSEDEKTGPDWQEVSESVTLPTNNKNIPTIVEEQETQDVVKDDGSQDGVIFREHVSNNEPVIETVNDTYHEESYFDISTEDSEDESQDNDNYKQEEAADSSDVVFSEVSKPQEDVVFDETPIVKEKKSLGKTGASALEVLPQEGKFPPGNYLIIYSVDRKALAYFRLDNAGSIIIGRSSERGSPNDIDITMAWKKYHQDKFENELEFQEIMRMVKGISRKHALIRYDKDKKSYVLFHLSDKNYTIVNLPGEDKRERAPGNRNPLYLKHNSLISMGNNKNYIIMRFKTI